MWCVEKGSFTIYVFFLQTLKPTLSRETIRQSQMVVHSFLFVFFKYIFLMFISFWERDSTWAGEGQRERGRHRIWTVSTEPNVGLELMSHEIMTWAWVGCLTDWATWAPLKWRNILKNSWEVFYKRSRSWKAREKTDKLTGQRWVRRHGDWMQCGILMGYWNEKRTLVEKLVKSKCTVNVPSFVSSPWQVKHRNVRC